MKYILPILLLSLFQNSYARECEVFGISDSPQKLTCDFQNLKIKLTCRNGSYFLNNQRVNAAYHYDVEYGSVPLVFEAGDSKMIVVMEPKVDIVADLERKGRSTLTGTCL